MIDKSCLRDVLAAYKRDFVSHEWYDEKYKLEAIKCFQDSWDVNADDFADMLHRSLDKAYNLLDSGNYFPRRMIELFAKIAPDEVRAMFIDLYDENKDIYGRIEEFKDQAQIMLEKYGNGVKNHFQTENAISVYLWLRYPDRYYIYKFTEVKKISEELESDYAFKAGSYEENIRNAIRMYDEIREEIKLDTELLDIFHSQMTDTCYHDPEFRTLTQDVGFYLNHYWKPAEWFPSDYNPGLSVDDWVGLLNDQGVFNESSLEIVCRMKDYGGQATCTQLSAKYGESRNFYSSGSVALAQRVVEKTDCPVLTHDYENARWWTVLYVGKSAGEDEEGSYIWKLRDELSEALEKVDLSSVRIYALRPYTKEDFLEEVYMPEARYDRLVAVLRDKKNLILQGAPGVGKTFAAKRIAYSMMGEMDEDRIEFVQFHQNYSYEDFVMGYKPVEDGFELKYGIFYRFCQKATSQPDKDFFFIIDEINRGNMSKIFGELLMLIEKDYRGETVTLAYDGLPFAVPKNLYIIGMMNTADRSLAMIDYALRRRFSFLEMEPAFDSDGFKRYQSGLNNENFDELVDKVEELNEKIKSDRSLGKGFCIGHSYFCGHDTCTDEWLRLIVDFDILPMLSEYWFDESEELRHWDNILHEVRCFDDKR